MTRGCVAFSRRSLLFGWDSKEKALFVAWCLGPPRVVPALSLLTARDKSQRKWATATEKYHNLVFMYDDAILPTNTPSSVSYHAVSFGATQLVHQRSIYDGATMSTTTL